MNEPSTLSFNIVRMMYELFSHNYEAITYFILLLLTLFWAIKKPTRTNFLLALGIGLLLFNFQYEKHISEGLRIQTEQSLTGGRGHVKIKNLIQITTEFFFPIATFVTGWALIGWSLFKEHLEGFWLFKMFSKKPD